MLFQNCQKGKNGPYFEESFKQKTTVPKSVQPFVESKHRFFSCFVNKLSVAITVVLIHLSTMIWKAAAGKFEPNLASLDQSCARALIYYPFLATRMTATLRLPTGRMIDAAQGRCAQIDLRLTLLKSCHLND